MSQMRGIFALFFIFVLSACGVDESMLNAADSENDFDVTKKKTDVPLQGPQFSLEGYWFSECGVDGALGDQIVFHFNGGVFSYGFVNWEFDNCTGEATYRGYEEGSLIETGAFAEKTLEGQPDGFLVVELLGNSEEASSFFTIYMVDEHTKHLVMSTGDDLELWTEVVDDERVSEFVTDPYEVESGAGTYIMTIGELPDMNL